MVEQLLKPEIEDLIKSRDVRTLREVLADWQPADVAGMMVDLTVAEKVLLFQALPTEKDASTFEYLDLDTQQALLNSLPETEITSILNGMAPDDRTPLFEELPPAFVTRLR